MEFEEPPIPCKRCGKAMHDVIEHGVVVVSIGEKVNLKERNDWWKH
jgi:hypothetical protein